MNLRAALRCLLPSLAVALCLAAGGAPASAASGGRVVVRALAAGGPHPLAVRDARILVFRRGTLIGRGRTGSLGMALVRTQRAGNGPLRVVVAGGTVGRHKLRGRLAALAPRYRWPHTVHVNLMTTLAARFSAAHPKLSRARVAQRVRSFLRLPAGYLLGADGRADIAFDGRRFLDAARRHGGVERFEAGLVAAMGHARSHHSFPPHPRGRRRAADASVAATAMVLERTGPKTKPKAQPKPNPEGEGEAEPEPSDSAAEVAEDSAKVNQEISSGSAFFGVLEQTDEVLDFVDALVSLTTDEQGAELEKLEELGAELQAVEEGVTALREEATEIRNELKRNAYSAQALTATATLSAVATAEETIEAAVQFARQGHCRAKEPHSHLELKDCESAGELIESWQTEWEEEGPTTVSSLRSLATAIAGDAIEGAEGEGILQLGSALILKPHQTFFAEAESERLARLSGFWVSRYAEALLFDATLWELEGQSEAVLERHLKEAMKTAGQVSKATPILLAGTVVDLRHATMWPTLASARGTGHPWSWFREQGPWEFVAGKEGSPDTWVSAGGATVPAFTAGAATPGEYKNWEVAGLEQIKLLLENVKPGEKQSKGEALLEATGIAREVITPKYGAVNGVGGGQGLEMQDLVTEVGLSTYEGMTEAEREEGGFQLNSGCFNSAILCIWPVWVGDGATIGNFNGEGEEWGVPVGWEYHYREAKFRQSEAFDTGPLLWGLYEGTYFGNDPIENIPNLFYRPVGAECFFYPPEGLTTTATTCP